MDKNKSKIKICPICNYKYNLGYEYCEEHVPVVKLVMSYQWSRYWLKSNKIQKVLA